MFDILAKVAYKASCLEIVGCKSFLFYYINVSAQKIRQVS